MTATLRRDPPGGGGSRRATTRVTLRELRETATRALRAAGATAGEADAAATVTTLAELHEAAGLPVLLAELAHVPTGAVPVTGRRDTVPGGDLPVTVLDDPAGRGPLLIGRLAVDLCAATGRPVLIPGHGAGPGIVWTVLETAERLRLGLEVVAPGPGGAVVAAVTADGALYHPRGDPAAGPGGVLIRRAGPAHPVAPATTATSRADRHRAALADGIDVDRQLWDRAGAAAHRFLVPEPRST